MKLKLLGGFALLVTGFVAGRMYEGQQTLDFVTVGGEPQSVSIVGNTVIVGLAKSDKSDSTLAHVADNHEPVFLTNPAEIRVDYQRISADKSDRVFTVPDTGGIGIAH